MGADQFSASLSSEERQQLLQGLAPLVEPAAPSPGMTFGTPTAFGVSGGRAFVGLSGIANDEYQDEVDGSMVLGGGFGHPVENVGLEVAVAIISLTDDFADSGSVGLKLHKAFADSGFGVAVGWSNALKWGDAEDDEDTVYAVTSKNFERASFSLGVGVGTGAFRTVDDIEDDENNVNVFGSIGVRLHPRVSLASSWTGSELNIGLGLAPFDFPLKAMIGVIDVTEEKDAGRSFGMNVGYSISY